VAAWREQRFAEPNCTIRLIHYPPQPNPEDNEFGFAPHTDNNFSTFLAQSRLPGLEVPTPEGEWIRPPAVPGTFVVNTGAMLARYSNDRFRATPHRVINRSDASRYAIPFFLGPNHDSIVTLWLVIGDSYAGTHRSVVETLSKSGLSMGVPSVERLTSLSNSRGD
jgi:isopenicillin N synthase-like dioxygenase